MPGFVRLSLSLTYSGSERLEVSGAICVWFKERKLGAESQYTLLGAVLPMDAMDTSRAFRVCAAVKDKRGWNITASDHEQTVTRQ